MSILDEALPSKKTYFVQVILPLAIAKAYTYRVPYALVDRMQVGSRAIVQFGKNRIYSAIIRSIDDHAPERYEAKYILDIVDDDPIVGDRQLLFWEWIASYYMCSVGEVMQAALPAALKMASETRIRLSDDKDVDRSELSDKGFLVVEALDVAGELRVSDVAKILGQKTVFPLLKSLFEKGFILISEEITTKYKPKTRGYIVLHSQFDDPVATKEVLDSLNRAPKQQDALLGYLHLRKNQARITKKELDERTGCGVSAIKALVDKEIFSLREEVVSRLDGQGMLLSKGFVFSPAQEKAYVELQRQLDEKDVVLLHGVTASGKTQLYIRLIEKAIERGTNALFLLPEIALTAQITERLKLYFGDKLGVYHSRFNDNERVEIWQKVLKNEYHIVVGARSAVFLPFVDLGLIIIDEEHENSYKQYDPAPRYHARDAAVYLATSFGAKVVLGSATPSVESYYNAKAGKYGFVELKERFGQAQLPIVNIINIAEESRKEQMKSYFSDMLLQEITLAVERKEQVILFQNRRGHTPFLQCGTCGYVAKCLHCDVSLTYHKTSHRLHCHYCGFAEDPMEACPACGTTNLQAKGFGTERVEEELELLMPELRIGRLDFDSTKGKYGFDRVLSAFDDGEYDVLIGTQMVAKGLDFGRVSLIGIVHADAIINYPDFRAYERAFALLSQVAGRAGRRDEAGKVLIQTYTPQHRVIEQVMGHDYEAMFMQEVTERKKYFYPPFYRIIRIDVKHPDQDLTQAAAIYFAGLLRVTLAHRVLGPEVPLVSRVRNQYIMTITLKIERQQISIQKVKESIAQAITHFSSSKQFRAVRILVDVDPY